MTNYRNEQGQDEIILVARLLLMSLFIVFGWTKLIGYEGTVGYMTQTGLPIPQSAAIVAIVAELFVGVAIVLGLWTRPLVLLLMIYTLATAFIGHQFWTMDGMARYGSAVNFYKNISIIGGLALLYVTGPGRYSLDARLRLREPVPATLASSQTTTRRA